MEAQEEAPIIYQLKVSLKKVSPMIWRRLLIQSKHSLADLHHSIQIAFGWSDSHLHQFVIYGKSYGIAYAGGMSFPDDADEIYLQQFQFRMNERFLYEYNFPDDWQYELRVVKN